MFARVTHFDIDTVAVSMRSAVQRFDEQILPELKKQQGYRGVCVLHNEAGRGLLISFWESERDANAGVASGFYAQQAGKFITFYRQQPEREHFEVGYLDAPIEQAARGRAP